jgi:hypothetical protein
MSVFFALFLNQAMHRLSGKCLRPVVPAALYFFLTSFSDSGVSVMVISASPLQS